MPNNCASSYFLIIETKDPEGPICTFHLIEVYKKIALHILMIPIVFLF